ncbi:FAD-dependent oxidoreductase [Phenylobacterium montanum]|uniref:GMC family oxidoreductase n=1 Tax=Phenylobacterium montanum TaxID=2823693 RepID=A0A975IUV7_9CAUL|nr:FAD-dependent oxidoreductase [Caulobacter sp. S6]QUD87914.1 GMC family oxidoreductase [Caulobacter sp. S6]
MILDARQDGAPRSLKTGIAIIGSGAAGLTLALELDRLGLDCVVLEAGGDGFDKSAQEFYRAASISPEDHGPVHMYRRREFGGTTSIWGGRCIPFDPIDFEDRPWIPRGRWPVSYDEVAAHYLRALEICKAGPNLFRAEEGLPGSQAPMVEGLASEDVILDRIERFSEPTHFGRAYREQITASKAVTVLVNAVVVEITASEGGRAATGVLAKTTAGAEIRIEAPTVVVAAGALETARLLLASRSAKACGLGNEKDLVGRFYQSHLEGEVGEIQFKAAAERVRLDYERSPEGIYCRRYIWLSPEAQRREKLGGLLIRPTHVSIADPGHGNPVLSAMYIVKDLLVPEYGRKMTSTEREAAGRLASSRSALFARHLTNVVLGSPRLMAFGLNWVRKRNLAKRKLPSVVLRDARGHYVLDVNAEQTPNFDSRVHLSDQLDPLGVPRLHVDWRTTAQDRDMVARALPLIQKGFATGKAAEVQFGRAPADYAARLTRIGGHHIGTARMAASADDGVVDANGQAFDCKGLYVAGASSFATSGFANPTLVIVALALRLAQHLKDARQG